MFRCILRSLDFKYSTAHACTPKSPSPADAHIRPLPLRCAGEVTAALAVVYRCIQVGGSCTPPRGLRAGPVCVHLDMEPSCAQEYNEKVTLLLTTPCTQVYRQLCDALPQRVSDGHWVDGWVGTEGVKTASLAQSPSRLCSVSLKPPSLVVCTTYPRLLCSWCRCPIPSPFPPSCENGSRKSGFSW